ncbi:hypothetical protein [Friedmanniella luteola]|uniref:hypothetical protein n=1 Tax=Friedmanniella luteola TaxID=546871 RepID=UPI003CCA591A
MFGHWAGHDVAELAQVAAAQRSGVLVADLEPVDLWALLIALAGTWAQASITWTATPDVPEVDHERRRRALAATVRRALCR